MIFYSDGSDRQVRFEHLHLLGVAQSFALCKGSLVNFFQEAVSSDLNFRALTQVIFLFSSTHMNDCDGNPCEFEPH